MRTQPPRRLALIALLLCLTVWPGSAQSLATVQTKLTELQASAQSVLERNKTLKPNSKLPGWTIDAQSKIITTAAAALAELQIIIGPPKPPPPPLPGGGSLSGLPLLQDADITIAGAFKQPIVDGYDRVGGAAVDGAIAYNPAGPSLYITADSGVGTAKVAEISIPTLVTSSSFAALNEATILQGKQDVTEGHRGEICPLCDIGYFRMRGMLVALGKLYFTGHIFYDASNEQRLSHGSHSLTLGTSSFQGWVSVYNNTLLGHVSGSLSAVPAVAQAALGGPYITEQCCTSILSRASFGPTAFTFDLAGVTGVSADAINLSANKLLDYTEAHPLHNYIANPTNEMWSPVSQVSGCFIPTGYRAYVCVGMHGYGPYCYGAGTSNPALAGTPYPDPVTGPFVYCYDPSGEGEGVHAYPYRYQMWVYDLNLLAEVKAGTRESWNVQPYLVKTLTFPIVDEAKTPGGLGYDPVANRAYFAQIRGAYSTVIQVIQFATP